MNNVTYIRYAESARINWAQNYAIHLDPTHKREWSELWTPKGDGLILRSMKTEFKFVGDPRRLGTPYTDADVAFAIAYDMARPHICLSQAKIPTIFVDRLLHTGRGDSF